MEFPEIPGYTISRRLGKGSIATIYLAEQSELGHAVALKVIPSPSNADDAFRLRLMDTIRLAVKILHPSFVHLYDVGEHEDLYYISMEYISGGNLKGHMREKRTLVDAVRIVKEIATALDYAEEHHWIHHCLTPDDVLLRKDSSIAICSFGMAEQSTIDTAGTDAVTGSSIPHYMSPEQAKSAVLDGRSGLYSLGVIFFEMLAGYVPYDADSSTEIGMKHISDAIPRLPQEMRVFQPFVDRALAKQPELRFQNGMEMVDAFENLEKTKSDIIYSGVTNPLYTPDEVFSLPPIESPVVVEKHTSGVLLSVAWSPDPELIGLKIECKTFPFTIGRSASADLEFTDDRISRAHAEIRKNGNKFLLQDTSTKGTIVNGQRVIAEFLPLPSSSSIELPDGSCLDVHVHWNTGLTSVQIPNLDSGDAYLSAPTQLLDENVQFTAYCPREIRPEVYTTVLAFAHLEELPPEAPTDAIDPEEEVKRQARNVLGDEIKNYRSTTQESLSAIPREGELIFVLELDGFRCNPPRQTVFWEENVHRVEFRVRAPAALHGKTCRGQLRVFLGDILLAEVVLRVLVTRSASADRVPDAERLPLRRYRKIFASYSRSDAAIVEQFERYAAGLGDEYLRDVVHLRTGENWNAGLKRLIDEADVFQLFWSTNSMLSPFVREEWMYALSLSRSHFVRPLYWEQPFPEDPPHLPPPELRELHFNLLGRYVGSQANDESLESHSPIASGVPADPIVPMNNRATSHNVTSDGANPERTTIHLGKRSTSRSIGGARKPRVHISYELEGYGSQKSIELPFVIGVFADLSGRSDKIRSGIQERQFLDVDEHNFEHRMMAIKPRVAFSIPNTTCVEGGELDVDITFESMADFSPMGVIRKIASLNALLQERLKIASPTVSSDGSDDSPTGSMISSSQARVAEIDSRLTAQVNEIIHHEDFQHLESAWRGLRYLVNNTETDETLKIRVLDISKKELAKAVKRSEGRALGQSALFTAIYEDIYCQIGGEPFGCLIGDYYFDHSPQDVTLLTDMAEIAATLHAPFISGAASTLFGLDSWQQLGSLRDLANTFNLSEYIHWRALRESQDARYIWLAMPRILARKPYETDTQQVEEFHFEEDTTGENLKKFTWMNAAYAMAVNVNKSFKEHGWFAQIQGFEGGGLVHGLPVHNFQFGGDGPDQKRSTEIGIDERHEAALAKTGLNPLCSFKNGELSLFITVKSLMRPTIYDDPEATAAAAFNSRFPTIFSASRFAHYVMAIVRDKHGTFSDDEAMESFLNHWIADYVQEEPELASEQNPSRPLASAEVRIRVSRQSRSLVAVLTLRPWYQLEGLSRPFRVFVQLPGTVLPEATAMVAETDKGLLSARTQAAAQEPTPSSSAATELPEGLVQVLEVPTPSGSALIELHHGDITAMSPDDAVDVLIVSAFPDSYEPTEGSLIATLHGKGISVGALANAKQIDLREAFSCWLSTEVPDDIPGIHFKQILCFESLYRGVSAPEAVGDIFRSLAPFVGGDPYMSTVAMPVVAAGAQGYELNEILPPLLNSAAEWLKTGLPLKTIKIFAYGKNQALQAKRIFDREQSRLQRRLAEQEDHPRYDAFISYAREDSPAALAIAEFLQGRNRTVFIDQMELDHGSAWQQHIFEALDRASKVIVVYSPNYVQSKVCQEEFNIAWARGRKMSSGFILPIYWRSGDLPTYMEMLNFADCRERREDKLQEVCSALDSSLKNP